MRSGFKRHSANVLVALLMLSGCTSLNGAPRPVISVDDSISLLASYKIDTAIKTFRKANDSDRFDMTPQQYRDMVISVYLNAIDARYLQFRRAVSSEGRGGTALADLAVLGLTTSASVIEKSATELSAIAAGIAGSKGIIDKNLYFNKALPALLAAMDAERTKARTQIVLNMRKDANAYPLETAFGDIAAYEAAGSLDLAVDNVTASASEDRKMEKLRYENAVRACDGEEDVVDNRSRIMKFVGNLTTAGNNTDLDKMAKQMGLAGGTDANVLRTEIRRDLIANYCTNDKLDELITAVGKQSWGASI